ncbi:MAG: phosphoribosyltransferase [Bacteroidetes bacterium]|nr:phosphoribosyltransferase [Bacteroidota bacterium]
MFIDRRDAAIQLSYALAKYKECNGIVMAIPRGGVPLGYTIANTLHLPLELILAKKIGHPMNREYAIGSVTLSGITTDPHFTDVDPEYIIEEGRRIQEEISRRYALFTGKTYSPNVKGKIIILVDDGIATGKTLMAAVCDLRKMNPSKIVIAVPVAPPEAAERFKKIADEYICLLEPDNFEGVGQFYNNFSEVTDDEVLSILKKSRGEH